MSKIVVRIWCKRVLHYDQEVELTQEEYDLLKEESGNDVDEASFPKQYRMIESKLNSDDATFDDHEFTDFVINKAK